MADLLLLDWDDRQVRALFGSESGGSMRVREAASAELNGDPTAANIASALKPLVAGMQAGKAKVAVVLGGRDVQSRLLRVPPVPAEEMPDVVRLRASTEFPTVDDSAVIDYLPMPAIEDQSATVLAARVTEKMLAMARDVCTKLHLTLQHVVMRGCGVAEVATRAKPELVSGVHLIAALRGGELELVGIRDGKPAVIRTIPVPADGDVESRATAATREIRRTIAAVTSELNANTIDSRVWIVGSDDDVGVAERTARALSRRIDTVDLRTVAGDVSWPADASAYSGMLGCGHSIASRDVPLDFLAPRRPPEKKAPIRTYALAGSLAAMVLLGGGWFIYSTVNGIETAITTANDERNKTLADLKKLEPEQKQSAEIEKWLATDVNWLDEIDRVAVTLRPEPLDNHEKFDVDRDVILRSITAKQAAGRQGEGGSLELAGAVRDDAVLEAIENQLRDDRRQVNPKSLVTDTESSPYVWKFQDDIVVTRVEEDRR
ncbi:hypothetical protein [Aeoliella sp. SH292]|uniref:hypothetical protein n=1 Tax=Aeoliella sp. SH292 TaxID=3454464 RepID=UPI003F964A0E